MSIDRGCLLTLPSRDESLVAVAGRGLDAVLRVGGLDVRVLVVVVGHVGRVGVAGHAPVGDALVDQVPHLQAGARVGGTAVQGGAVDVALQEGYGS